MPTDFERYLSEPCDREACENTATHNGTDRATGARGQFCNQHCDWDAPAFARDD